MKLICEGKIADEFPDAVSVGRLYDSAEEAVKDDKGQKAIWLHTGKGHIAYADELDLPREDEFLEGTWVTISPNQLQKLADGEQIQIRIRK